MNTVTTLTRQSDTADYIYVSASPATQTEVSPLLQQLAKRADAHFCEQSRKLSLPSGQASAFISALRLLLIPRQIALHAG